jgi:hypothetical protein
MSTFAQFRPPYWKKFNYSCKIKTWEKNKNTNTNTNINTQIQTYTQIQTQTQTYIHNKHTLITNTHW